MPRSSAKQKPKMFYATMHVTRVEHWCVEASTPEEAEALLRSGEGQRHDIGACVHRDVHKIEEDG